MGRPWKWDHVKGGAELECPPLQTGRSLNLIRLRRICDLESALGWMHRFQQCDTLDFVGQKVDFPMIFVSHSHKDYSEFVDGIVRSLRDQKVVVSVVNSTSNSRQEAYSAVTEALKGCDTAVVVASPRYFESDWCRSEIGALWTLRLAGRLRLLVIRHDMSERELFSVQPLFAGLDTIDSTNPVPLITDWILDADTPKTKRKKSEPPIPVILSGCGYWARERTVLPLLQRSPELFRVVAVTDLEHDEEEYRKVVQPAIQRVIGEEKANEVKFFSHLPGALAEFDDNLESGPVAVAINTPNRFHDSLATVALQSGYDVYAERPINRYGEKLPVLLQRAREHKLYLYTGTQRRAEDSFSYLRHAVANRKGFGELRSIRCTLASGRRPVGWRKVFNMAGGGIVMDEGYHLLDAALWVATAAHPTFAAMTQIDVNGYAKASDLISPKIECTAVGALTLDNIDLYFDLSYQVPPGCVHESLELRDADGGRIRLLRDQVKRDSTPGYIIHQLASGEVVHEGYVYKKHGQFHFDLSPEYSSADNTGPLRQFLHKVGSGTYTNDELLEVGENECDARFVSATQELIKGIYRLSGL